MKIWLVSEKTINKLLLEVAMVFTKHCKLTRELFLFWARSCDHLTFLVNVSIAFTASFWLWNSAFVRPHTNEWKHRKVAHAVIWLLTFLMFATQLEALARERLTLREKDVLKREVCFVSSGRLSGKLGVRSCRLRVRSLALYVSIQI